MKKVSPTDALIESQQLNASGAFDESFYLPMAGKRSSANAARNFLIFGWRNGISPHPLIEFEYIAKSVWESVRRGHYGAFLSWLRSKEAQRKPWGPLFDPRELRGAKPLSVLASLRDEDLVPVPSDFVGEIPTLGAVRSSILDWMAQYGEELNPSLPPRTPKWDDKATAEWFSVLPERRASQALVSVIMPAKDREDTIASAIDSALSQSHFNLELIIVDDGSEDLTAAISADYASRDARVRLVDGPHRGVGPARQAGLEIAKGEFVAFLDSDNVWTDRYLEYSLTVLAHDTELVATHAGLRLHNDGGVIEYRGGEVSSADLQLGNSVDINVLVTRRSLIERAGGFDLTLKRWVDYDLVLRLQKLGQLRYLPFVGCDYSNRTRRDRITRRESPHWEWVVKGKNLVEWAEIRTRLEHRVSERVSAVVIVSGAFLTARRAVDSVLSEAVVDVEVVVVDCGSASSVGRRFAAVYAREPRVRYVRLAANPHFSAAANFGFAHTTGAQVVFLSSLAMPSSGWLTEMVHQKQQTDSVAVQPLIVQSNGAVLNAGYGFLGSTEAPSPLFADLNSQDVHEANLERLTALSRDTLLIEADIFAAVNGFDAFLSDAFEDVDLCLRIRRELGPDPAVFSCTTDAVVAVDSKTSPAQEKRQLESKRLFLERWSDAGVSDDRKRYEEQALQVAHIVPGQGSANLYVTPLLTPVRRDSEELRWAIKIGASYKQDRWGDVPFADDLAKALRGQGQKVCVDRYGAHDRAGAYLDDVVLTIRGRWAISPQPGAVNILWVISRPDLVTVEEILAYDIVYAASEKWAAWMSAQSGRSIEVLNQATDPERFRPDLEPFEPADDVVFVGGPRTEGGELYGRRLIGFAVQAGARLGVWGLEWENFIPKEHVHGGFLDFEYTPHAYSSSQIALNDHWGDMREWGFISNRAFDIIACGTPVISDEIHGLELFQGAAAAAGTVEQMRELITDRSWVPSSERMIAISDMVRRDHSFEARAATLLQAALQQCAARVL